METAQGKMLQTVLIYWGSVDLLGRWLFVLWFWLIAHILKWFVDVALSIFSLLQRESLLRSLTFWKLIAASHLLIYFSHALLLNSSFIYLVFSNILIILRLIIFVSSLYCSVYSRYSTNNWIWVYCILPEWEAPIYIISFNLYHNSAGLVLLSPFYSGLDCYRYTLHVTKLVK